jgi:hypothetical protein
VEERISVIKDKVEKLFHSGSNKLKKIMTNNKSYESMTQERVQG